MTAAKRKLVEEVAEETGHHKADLQDYPVAELKHMVSYKRKGRGRKRSRSRGRGGARRNGGRNGGRKKKAVHVKYDEQGVPSEVKVGRAGKWRKVNKGKGTPKGKRKSRK